MKFTEGIWYDREGIEVQTALEVGKLDTSITELPFYPLLGKTKELKTSQQTTNEAFIRAVCHNKEYKSRSDALNKPNITVSLKSPADGIISVEVQHFLGRPELKEPRVNLFPSATQATVSFGEDEALGLKTTSLTTGDGSLSAEMSLTGGRFGLRFWDLSKGEAKKTLLTEAKKEDLGWVLDKAAGLGTYDREYATNTIGDHYFRPPATVRKSFMKASLGLTVGEKVYGFGERFGPFVRNGQTVEISAEDGGTSSSIAYKNIPFYMTSKGYGVFYDHTDHISFEVQSDTMTKVQASVPGETIRFYVIAGPTPKEILSRYTLLTGRPPLPPDWSFGLWLSTSFLTNYDEPTVMSFIDEMKNKDIPLSVFHFDCFWMRAHEWCNLDFDPEYFPDPKGFMDRIHDKGVKVCVWINPYIAQESRLFKEGDDNGYFLKRKSTNTTFQSDDWQSGMAFIDFTNPEAVKWYQQNLRAVLKVGVDSFKTDFGERIPAFDIKYQDGSNPHAMHNYYSYLYNRAVYDLIVDERGQDQAMVFARSGYVGSQTMPVHWGGDCDKEWTGMAESLRGGLSIGLAGFGFWSHDIGGFKREGRKPASFNDPEEPYIYKRWVQFGLLSSHSRLHGSETYRVPWLIDQEACEVLSKFTKLKNRMEPYLTSVSIADVVAKGIPMLRPMLLEFPEEAAAWNLDTQYMLGSSLLVAPVFGHSQVDYYVPKGAWTNVLTGAAVTGPAFVSEEHDMFTLPLLLRPDTGLVIGKEGHSVTDLGIKRGFTVIVASSATAKFVTEISTRSGQKVAFEVMPAGKTITVKMIEGPKGLEFDVIVIGDGSGLDNPKRVGKGSGGSCKL